MTADTHMDGSRKAGDDAAVQELFQTAALILGDEEEAVVAFEKAVAGTEVDPCAEPALAYQQARDLLTRLAVERAVALDPPAFLPESQAATSDVCLDTDDLSATGLTPDQLKLFLSGGGRTRLRGWLEHLRPASRVVFVLRAVVGKDGSAVAEVLRSACGSSLWTAEQVGSVFRGALCSLASSLVHAPATT